MKVREQNDVHRAGVVMYSLIYNQSLLAIHAAPYPAKKRERKYL